ncbi:MAG: nitrate ABC transporter substrate-binding protein [Betaproteobacteria bacterium HGW-Betaproteobacteria-22]|nr:MAG: nitrate ABC transporter substrate-binding protein [Betaproteobacteria bacterium HGW-Betaproteobacteria-22]
MFSFSFFSNLKCLKRWYVVGLLFALLVSFAVKPLKWFEHRPVSIAANVWLGYEPMFLARSEGWLDSQQVHILETASATQSIQALMAGKVDAAALTLDETLKVCEMGLPVTIVMVFNISAGADKLLAIPEIVDLASLKGKRLGYEPSSAGEVMLAEVLNRAQLGRQDLKLHAIPVNQHHEAWHEKKVDAIITYEPTATHLLADGAHSIFDTTQIPNLIIDVLAVRTDRLNHYYAKSIKHLIAAHFKALRHLQHNPNDAAYRMAAHLQLNHSEVLAAYRGLVLPDLLLNHRLMAKAPVELLVSAEHLADIMLNYQLLQKTQDLSALIDASYLPTKDIFR